MSETQTPTEPKYSCRICLDEIDLNKHLEHIISPCACKGSSAYIHLTCFDKLGQDRCSICKFKMIVNREPQPPPEDIATLDLDLNLIRNPNPQRNVRNVLMSIYLDKIYFPRNLLCDIRARKGLPYLRQPYPNDFLAEIEARKGLPGAKKPLPEEYLRQIRRVRNRGHIFDIQRMLDEARARADANDPLGQVRPFFSMATNQLVNKIENVIDIGSPEYFTKFKHTLDDAFSVEVMHSKYLLISNMYLMFYYFIMCTQQRFRTWWAVFKIITDLSSIIAICYLVFFPISLSIIIGSYVFHPILTQASIVWPIMRRKYRRIRTYLGGSNYVCLGIALGLASISLAIYQE